MMQGIRRVTFTFSPNGWWLLVVSCTKKKKGDRKYVTFVFVAKSDFRSSFAVQITSWAFLSLGICPWHRRFHAGCVRVIKLLARLSLITKHPVRNSFHDIGAVKGFLGNSQITITRGKATETRFEKIILVMISGDKGDCARGRRRDSLPKVDADLWRRTKRKKYFC